MPGRIGYDIISGTGHFNTNWTNSQETSILPSQHDTGTAVGTYVAVANDHVVSLHLGGWRTSGPTDVNVAVYDITDQWDANPDGPYTGATLVDQTAVTVGTVADEWTVLAGLQWTLTAGRRYAMCLCTPTTTITWKYRQGGGLGGDQRSRGAVETTAPATFTESSFDTDRKFSLYATVEEVLAGPSIDTVTASTPTDTTLPAGSTAQTTNADGGTYWAGIWPQSSRPTTHAQIIGGIGAVGAVETNAILPGGALTFGEFTGLSPTTAYALYVTAVDDQATPVADGAAGFDDFTTLQQAVVVEDTLIDVATGQPIAAGVDVNYWLWNDTDISPGPMGAPILQGTTTTVDPAGGFNIQIDVTAVAVENDALVILTHEDVPGGTPPQIDDNWGSGAVVVAVSGLVAP